MKQSSKKYNIPQEILYTVCLAAWDLCSRNLQKFAQLKAYYTTAFIADAVEAVEAAKQMSSSVETLAARREARINLINASRAVLANWQMLKLYINKAFDERLVEAKLREAGDFLYKKAALHNWNAVRSLVDTANIFIAHNLDQLTANGNMPAAFQTTFKTDGERCVGLSITFYRINMDKERATQMKIDANNAIYAGVIEMLKDGQQIFRNDEVNQRQFIFRFLVKMHRGEGTASLKGYITNALDQPLEGVIVQSENRKYTGVTDSKGYYRISRIAAGDYTFDVTGVGYHPVSQTITFATGTASKADFVMEKQMQRVA